MSALSVAGLTIERLARRLLREHADVSDTPPNDGEMLRWNAAQSKWIPATGSGSSSLDGLTDVVVPTPSAGDILLFDGANWINTKTLTHLLTFSAGLTVSGGVASVTSADATALVALTLTNTGIGDIVLKLARTSGTSADWMMSIPTASGSLVWNTSAGGSNKLTLTTAGALSALASVGAPMWLGAVVDSGSNTDLLLKRNGVVQATIGASTSDWVGNVYAAEGFLTAMHFVSQGHSAPYLQLASNVTTGTSSVWLYNSAGAKTAWIAQERSAGGAVFTGSTAYALVLGTTSAAQVEFAVNSTIVHSLSSTIASFTQAQLLVGSSTRKARFGQVSDGRADMLTNVWFDGANWNLDDVANPGMLVTSNSGFTLAAYQFTAGANPRTPMLLFSVDASGNTAVTGTFAVTSTTTFTGAVTLNNTLNMGANAINTVGDVTSLGTMLATALIGRRTAAGDQLQVGYDQTYYLGARTASDGKTTFTAHGTGAEAIYFNPGVISTSYISAGGTGANQFSVTYGDPFTATQYAQFGVGSSGLLTLSVIGTTPGMRVNPLVGFGTDPVASSQVWILATALTGTQQTGLGIGAVGTSQATSQVSGLAVQVGTTAASFTSSALVAVAISDASKGAGSTITTQYGLKIEDQTKGTTNYTVYAGTGLARFADSVRVGEGSASLPGLTFWNDPDTGLYGATNVLGFTTGGSMRATIDSSGFAMPEKTGLLVGTNGTRYDGITQFQVTRGSTTTLFSIGSNNRAYWAVVSGRNGTTDGFIDVIVVQRYGNTPTVTTLSSTTTVGTPGARTYTVDIINNLQMLITGSAAQFDTNVALIRMGT